jgi:predicted Zn-dependent peptidase
MVICLAGAVDHDEVVSMVQELFPMEQRSATRPMLAFEPGKATESRVYLQTKKTEQAHLVCGMMGLPEEHPDHYAVKVLSAILGGNMSSRMFLAVREEKGLAYYISCGTEDYLDTGTYYTRAGVDVNRIDDAIKAIILEYEKMASEPVPEAELKKGKEFLKGKLTLSLEDSEQVAQMHARNELLYNKIKTLADISAAIDKVTAEDVSRVAKALLRKEALYLAVIGPYDKADRFEALL